MNSEIKFPFGEKEILRDGGLFFIFEMANNHQGSLEHGLEIIRTMGEILRSQKISAAVKFQFRCLEFFLHPGFLKARLGPSTNKHTRRFIETGLSFEDYRRMVQEARENDLVPVATPFDEASVEWCARLELPVIKIASSSAADWPLLRRVARANRPVVASTAGLSWRQIDDLVVFFERQQIPLAIMHCRGVYPAPREHLQLDQIRKLRERYPDLVIGYSAHEAPADLDVAALAVASGAALLERHVGVPAANCPLNAYSLSPDQVKAWVEGARAAHLAMNAGQPRARLESESLSLDELKRGIYVRVEKHPGQFLAAGELFLAMPCLSGQFSAAEIDEVIGLPVPQGGMKPWMPVMRDGMGPVPPEIRAGSIAERVRGMLAEAKIVLPEGTMGEISHPHGLENFEGEGAVIIDIVNREYCKKLILQFPGQEHPAHKHIQKEETFHVLRGELEADTGGQITLLRPGDRLTIPRGILHAFRTRTGMILEEISTTHIRGDSVYTDERVPSDLSQRKTGVVL